MTFGAIALLPLVSGLIDLQMGTLVGEMWVISRIPFVHLKTVSCSITVHPRVCPICYTPCICIRSMNTGLLSPARSRDQRLAPWARFETYPAATEPRAAPIKGAGRYKKNTHGRRNTNEGSQEINSQDEKREACFNPPPKIKNTNTSNLPSKNERSFAWRLIDMSTLTSCAPDKTPIVQLR